MPANHGGEDLEEVSRHRDDAFAIRLGRGDHEQGDDLPVRSLVLADAELGELQQLLDADAGVAQGLDDGPLPERRLLGANHVDDLAGRLSSDAKARAAVEARQALIPFVPQAAVDAAIDRDELVGPRIPGEAEQLTHVRVVVLHVGDEQRQQGLAGSGAGGGALPDTPLPTPAADELGRHDGAGRDP